MAHDDNSLRLSEQLSQRLYFVILEIHRRKDTKNIQKLFRLTIFAKVGEFLYLCTMTQHEHDKIIDLIKREVILSIGCTEPMAVSLCVAKACETLGTTPATIAVELSANIFKNAMGVGIPNRA